MSLPITGMSIVSPLGNDGESIVKNIISKKRGLSYQHKFQHFVKSPLGESNFQKPEIFFENEVLFNQILFSVKQIADQTGVFERYKPSEIGFFFGTSTAEPIYLNEKINNMLLSNQDSLEGLLSFEDSHGFVAEKIKNYFPIAGSTITFTTACSSAATAISEAFFAIKHNLIKCCIVGGFDILTPLTVCGFNSLQILDANYCSPFSINRGGINLSDGGALFLIEQKENTCPEDVLAYLHGVGGSNDAYHSTQPEPNGAGAKLSMIRALRCADLRPSEIQCINAHGTGTLANDTAELKALRALFDENTNVTSTKAFHGHALGGAGALELAISILSLRQQKNFDSLLDKIAFEEDFLFFNKKSINKKITNILSNSFGFGGSNVSLIVGRDINK